MCACLDAGILSTWLACRRQDFDWAELRNIPVIESDPNSDPNTFDGEDSPEALNQVRSTEYSRTALNASNASMHV